MFKIQIRRKDGKWENEKVKKGEIRKGKYSTLKAW